MSSVSSSARSSLSWVSCLLIVLGSCGIAAAQCSPPYDFENPPYTASGAGTVIVGQPTTCAVPDQWYLPAVAGSQPGSVFTYAGNTIGISQNPEGGLQFEGGLVTAAGPIRAQHSLDFSATGLWRAEFDCTGRWNNPTGPAANNIGSLSLQPSPTSKYFQMLMSWGGAGNNYQGTLAPPPDHTADFQQFHIHWGYFTAASPTTIAFAVPNSSWLNLDVHHWYHLTMTWSFASAQILSVSIRDITAGGAAVTSDVYSLGWYLQGGPNSTLPLPTDFRLFAGTANDVSAWDNFSLAPVPAGDVGACCDLVTGICNLQFPNNCTSSSQQFSGPGSSCSQVTCTAHTGACCDPTGGCTTTTLANCSGGNLFRGLDSPCTLCVPQCQPVSTAPCQSRDNANAYLSDFTTFRAAENFIPSQSTITGVCVSGVYTTLNPLPTSHFRVKYYNNNNGLPGTLIAGASFEEGVNLTVSGPAATGENQPNAGAPVLTWNLSHASVAVTPGLCHWIEISNQASGGTPWYWDTSSDGEGYFVQDATPGTPYATGDIVGIGGVNLAFCLDNAAHNQTLNLAGLSGCAVGSCCLNICPFTCRDGLSSAACTAAATAAGGTATWTVGGTCQANCSAPQFCCRGDFNGDGVLNGKDIQGYAQALISPPVCSNDPTTICRLNVNEDFLVSANNTAPNPTPDDLQAFVTLLLAGGESADRICGAILVACNSTTLLDNTNATTSISDPDLVGVCGTTTFTAGSFGEGSMWLKFVATSATATVDTEGSTVTPPQAIADSILAIYHSTDGTPGSALGNRIACDDDNGTGALSLISLTGLTIGDTYYIELMDFPGENARGIYHVNVTCP